MVVGDPDIVDAGLDQAVDQGRVRGEDRLRLVPCEAIRRRVLEVRHRDVGARDDLADRPRVAGPPRPRQVPAERGTVPAARRDLGGAAGEREVGPATLDAERLVDAPVEQDVAAGEERPRCARIERCLVRPSWQLGIEPPVRGLLHAVDPEQRSVAPGERTHGRCHVLGADEPQALAVLRKLTRQGGGVLREHESGRVGRSRDTEGGKDRVGLIVDERQRFVAAAGPGQDRGDFRAVGRRDRRTELRDRHDRGLGERGRGRRRWAGRRRRRYGR